MHCRITFLVLIDILWLRCISVVNSQNLPIHICDEIIYPKINKTDNCTLICGLHFERYVGSRKITEIALCLNDRRNPYLCHNTEDCYRRHSGSYCKQIQCFCESFSEKHKFVAQSSRNTLSICIIPSSSIETRSAFPWKTILAVCGALGVVALIFVGIRWIYTIMQDMNQPNRCISNWRTARDDSFYPSVPSSPIETTMSTQERNYNQSVNIPDDKPPSYETIQLLESLPPPYEDSTRNVRQMN